MNAFKKVTAFLFSKFSKIQLIVLAGLIFFAFLIGDSNIFSRFSYDAEIRDLKNEISYYRSKTSEDSTKLDELKSNKENIEKFARENYLMKKENEEVFIVE